MTIQTIAAATETVAIAVSPVIRLKGKGKAKRELAYMQVSTFALFDLQAREAMLANLCVALGTNPEKDEIVAAREQHIIGRISRIMPGKDESEKIEKAREVFFYYAPSDRTRPIDPKVHKGKRTPEQDRAIVAARKHVSDAFAEIVANNGYGVPTLAAALLANGYGKAMTQSDANKVKRAAAMTGTTKRGKGKADAAPAPAPAAPAHSQLVKAPASLTAQEAVDHVCSVLGGLLKFSKSKSGAKVMPLAFGQFVERINAEAIALASEYAETAAKR